MFYLSSAYLLHVNHEFAIEMFDIYFFLFESCLSHAGHVSFRINARGVYHGKYGFDSNVLGLVQQKLLLSYNLPQWLYS